MANIENVNISFVRRNQPRRGPTSSEQQNDMQAEILIDFSRLQDQWNNRLVPLLATVPSGLGVNDPDGFTNGLDGRTVYVDSAATDDVTDPRFFSVAQNRPNTIKDQFEDVYSLVQTNLDTLQGQVDTLQALDQAQGDVTGPSAATDNAIARYNGTSGKIIQSSQPSIDDNGVLTSKGIVDTGNLTVSGVVNIGAGTVPAQTHLYIEKPGPFVFAQIKTTASGVINEGGLFLDRADETNGFSQLHHSTAGVDKWATGLRFGSDDYNIFNVNTVTDAIRIDGTTNNVAIGTVTGVNKFWVLGAAAVGASLASTVAPTQGLHVEGTIISGPTAAGGIQIVPGGNSAIEFNQSGDFIQHTSSLLTVHGGSGGVRLDVNSDNGLLVSIANLATGDETIFDFNAIVNKATSGNYTGIKLDVTEDNAPGADNRLLDLQVSGVSQLSVGNSGNIQFEGATEIISRGPSNFAITSTSGRNIELNSTGANVILNPAANSALVVQSGANPAWQWNNVTSAFEFTNTDIIFRRTDGTLKDVFVADRLTGDITLGDAVEGDIDLRGGPVARLQLSNSVGSTLFSGASDFFRVTSVAATTRIDGVDVIIADATRVLIDSVVALEIDGDLNHDGTNIGFYGTTPAAQSSAYTRNATIVEDRTLLQSSAATILNNNNVLAALIADLQSRGFIG